MWEDSSHGPCSLAGLQPAAFSRLLRLPRKGCRRSPGCPGSSCLSSYVKHSFVKEKEGGWKSLGCLGEEQQRIKSRHLQRLDLRPPPLTLPRLVALLLVPGRDTWGDARAGVDDAAIWGSRQLLVIYNLHQVLCSCKYNIFLYMWNKFPYPLPQFPSLPYRDDALSPHSVLYNHLYTRQQYYH